MKLEIKKEELKEENEDEMEVLGLMRTSSPLAHPPQDVPVDLTTSSKLCTDPHFQQMHYPYLNLQNHFPGFIIRENHGLLKTEAPVPFSGLKETKENTRITEIKNESLTNVQLASGHPKKRRLDDDFTNPEYLSIKRQKLEPSNYLTKPDCSPILSLGSTDPKCKDTRYLPLKTISDQYFPFNHLEHASLLENLKKSSASVKEIESLLAAVQQSQMLYYSYCAKLLHNLQVHKLVEEKGDRSRVTSYQSHSVDSRRSEQHDSATEISEHMKGDQEQARLMEYTTVASGQETPSSKSICPGGRVGSYSTRSSPTSPSNPIQPLGGAEEDAEYDLFTLKDGVKGPAGRKRAPRALTGKHVRPGTGASPTTLQTLRQKLEKRQQMRSSVRNRFSVEVPEEDSKSP